MEKPKIVFDATPMLEGLQRAADALRADFPEDRMLEYLAVWDAMQAAIVFRGTHVTTGADGAPQYLVQVVPGSPLELQAGAVGKAIEKLGPDSGTVN